MLGADPPADLPAFLRILLASGTARVVECPVMGVRLIVEVLDHAPEDLTQSEWAVLVVFAESANDQTRAGWPGQERLARRARISRRTVMRVVKALVKRDILVVVHKSYPGHPTVYRIALLKPDTVSGSDDVKGDTVSPLKVTTATFKGDNGDVTSATPTLKTSYEPSLTLNEPSSLSSAERIALGAGVVTEDETRPFVEWVKNQHPGVTPAWFRKLAENGDLADFAAEYYALIARGELCPHGRYQFRVAVDGTWITCPDCDTAPPELRAEINTLQRARYERRECIYCEAPFAPGITPLPDNGICRDCRQELAKETTA